MILNEITEEVLHTECHDCEAPPTGCMHGAAFLLWLHRRSEEPSFPHRESYWRKPKIAQDERKLKFITAKQLSRTKQHTHETEKDPNLINEFQSEAKRRNLDGPLISYLSAKEGDDDS